MDEGKIAAIKQTAYQMTKIFMEDVDEYVAECERIYGGGKFTDDEYAVIVSLCDVYYNVKTGSMTREEAIEKQRELFAGLRVSSI